MALGSFPGKSQSMTHFREVEMWTLILEHQQGNHPLLLRRSPRRAHRCCLLVSLGTDESAAFPLSLDGVLSKYKAGTPISQEAWENPLLPLLKLA